MRKARKKRRDVMSDIKAKKALLFDLDGTLVNTKNLILTSFRYATSSVLGASPSDEVMLDMIGIPLRYQMRKIDETHADEMLAAYREHNGRVHDELIQEFSGTAETLAKLTAAGYRLAVVTSKMSESALRDLRFFELDVFFEFVQGSDKTERHKPDPDPLLAAAKTMGLTPEQCAYVGDSPYDMQAARAAGMCAVAALWGMFSRERLLEAGAQQEAASIEELAVLFL